MHLQTNLQTFPKLSKSISHWRQFQLAVRRAIHNLDIIVYLNQNCGTSSCDFQTVRRSNQILFWSQSNNVYRL